MLQFSFVKSPLQVLPLLISEMIFVHFQAHKRLINLKYFSGPLFIMTPLERLCLVRYMHMIPLFKSKGYLTQLLGLFVDFLGFVLMLPQSLLHMTLGDLTGFYADSLMQHVIV